MKKVVFNISGMHCVSCAMNIDGELEDTHGVKESRTNFAKGRTEVNFDPQEVDENALIKIIKDVGYDAARAEK